MAKMTLEGIYTFNSCIFYKCYSFWCVAALAVISVLMAQNRLNTGVYKFNMTFTVGFFLLFHIYTQ